jgi:autotransporter-associated beta strand protein
MRFLRYLLFLLLVPWAGAATFTWSGAAGDGAYSNPANWSGGVVPPNDGSAVVVFGESGAGLVHVAGSLNLSQIRFENSAAASYSFTSASNAQIAISSGVVAGQSGGYARFGTNLTLNVTGAQTLEIASGSIEIAGRVLGDASLTKSGAGTLKLLGSNSWSGGITHASGTLMVGQHSSLGTGTLRLTGGALQFPPSDHAWIGNPVVIEADTQIAGAADRLAILSGHITLANSVTISASNSAAVLLLGSIQDGGASKQLKISGLAPVILAGTNSYSGGTVVEQGTLVFGTHSAVPSKGQISASATSYVGIGYNDAVQATFIDRLNPSGFQGIVGFDTTPGTGLPTRFNGAVDLSALPNYASVGSKTSAVLSGLFKVAQGADYKFGGGGGTLYVESNLTARGENLQVVSPWGTPLTLVLQGNNTFGGAANVLASVLVLDHKHAIKKSTPLNLQGPGYIGYTERAEFTPQEFLGRLGTIASADAIAGIDSYNRSAPRTVSDAIDLSLGGTRTDPYYLGTSSRVTLTGAITPTVGDALYLTAVKGGHLTVQSALGNNLPGLVIGQANSFDPQGGTVEIARAGNTYTSGTDVRGGTLRVSAQQALGTGQVNVGSRATLDVASGVSLNNPMSLASGARLSGTGQYAPAGGVFISNGAIVSPGALGSVGTLSFGSGLTLGPGGIFEFDIQNLSGPGSGWDFLSVNGTLTLTASGSSPFTISLYSISPDGRSGPLSGFDLTQSYTWQLAGASSIVGFNSSQFALDTSGFLNGTGGGAFFVSQSGNQLLLNFTPVPEPSTYVLIVAGGLLVYVFERRRRR